jgi:hypothetical protein
MYEFLVYLNKVVLVEFSPNSKNDFGKVEIFKESSSKP